MISIQNGETIDVKFAEDTELSFTRQCEIAQQAVDLAARARAAGVIVSISQQALLPPAMGNHVDVVTAFAARRPAGKGGAA
jgi:hypothetical protein